MVGLIFHSDEILKKTEAILIRRFGSIDYQSPVMDFGHTDYYREEFGPDLKRKFLSFKKPIRPQDLAKIKIITNKLEQKLALKGRRRINIDPGYLDMAKLVLASTKDYTHRIYLAKGIYAEITLFYENKSFRAWTWTYPDYQSALYLAVFNRIREIYAQNQ